MDYLYLTIFIVVGINILGLATQRPRRRPLHSRLTALGVVQGKSAEQIVSVLGAPELVSQLAGGQTQMRWSEDGDSLTLMFDGGRCAGRAAGLARQSSRSAIQARRQPSFARPRPRRMAR